MLLRLRHVVNAAVVGLTFGLSPADPLHAQGTDRVQTPGIEQEVLLNAPLSQFPGKRILVFTGEFEPGAQTPLHRHPGTELLFVLEGHGEMAISGRETRELSPGRVVLVEPDAGQDSFTHRAINLSEKAGMRTLVVVIHDEGTAPALPVSYRSQ